VLQLLLDVGLVLLVTVPLVLYVWLPLQDILSQLLVQPLQQHVYLDQHVQEVVHPQCIWLQMEHVLQEHQFLTVMLIIPLHLAFYVWLHMFHLPQIAQHAHQTVLTVPQQQHV